MCVPSLLITATGKTRIYLVRESSKSVEIKSNLGVGLFRFSICRGKRLRFPYRPRDVLFLHK